MDTLIRSDTINHALVMRVREAAGRLMRTAKDTGVPIVLVGHVTKDGAIAGPRVLEHMVDTVLYLEGERRLDFRILRATKNRFGATDEIGIFAMGESGLHEVEDPSALLLAEMSKSATGTAVVPVLEGTRPLLVEIQSLLSSNEGVMLRRTATAMRSSSLATAWARFSSRRAWASCESCC